MSENGPTWLHEMKNTLAAMRLWTEALRRARDDAERDRALDALTASVSLQAELLREAEREAGGEPALAPQLKRVDAAASPPPLAGIEILLLDDDRELREGVEAILGQMGARVTAVETIAAAFAQVAAAPQLIIADVRLKDGLGFDFLRAVRRLPVEQGGATPAIALTAAGQREDYEASLAAGFQIHLVKPPTLNELLAAIVSLTSTPR
jgi:CheY-like chemotaxis protein